MHLLKTWMKSVMNFFNKYSFNEIIFGEVNNFYNNPLVSMAVMTREYVLKEVMEFIYYNVYIKHLGRAN